MDLLQVALGFQTDGSAGGRRGSVLRRTDGLQVTKFLLHQLQNLRMSDVAGRGHDNVVRREPILEAAAKCFAIKIAHGFRCAEDGTAERMLRPEAAGKD